MAHSATSLVALLIGTAVITGLGFRWVSKRYFGTCVVAALVLGAAAQLTVGLYAPTLKMLGRNATLTDRTEVWADTLALDDSPILGTGFESFWLGKRLDILWAKWWWHPNEAHNGYIETYLSLGAVGLLLLIVLIVSAFRRISARFGDDFDIARLHMGFLFAIVIYNFTEATFKGLALLYTLFLIIALNVPHWRPVSTDIVSAKEPG
jgi:O-antigen ligase